MRPLNVLILPKSLKGKVEIPNQVMVRLDFMAYEYEDQDAYYVRKDRHSAHIGYMEGPKFRSMLDQAIDYHRIHNRKS